MPKYRVELAGDDTTGHAYARKLEPGGAEVNIRAEGEDWVRGHLGSEESELVIEIPDDDTEGQAYMRKLESGEGEITIKFEDGAEVQGHLRMSSDRALKTDVHAIAWVVGSQTERRS